MIPPRGPLPAIDPDDYAALGRAMQATLAVAD